jgi:hypothetical protein
MQENDKKRRIVRIGKMSGPNHKGLRVTHRNPDVVFDRNHKLFESFFFRLTGYFSALGVISDGVGVQLTYPLRNVFIYNFSLPLFITQI